MDGERSTLTRFRGRRSTESLKTIAVNLWIGPGKSMMLRVIAGSLSFCLGHRGCRLLGDWYMPPLNRSRSPGRDGPSNRPMQTDGRFAAAADRQDVGQNMEPPTGTTGGMQEENHS